MSAIMQCATSTAPAASRRRARLLTGLVLVLCAASYLTLTWLLRFELDDAYISYRYARNWARGNGPVYNSGETVEGYTNFLCTVCLLPAARQVHGLPVFARVLGVLCGLLGLPVAYWLARGLGSEEHIALSAPLVLACCPPYAAWATSGMETALFTLLVGLAVALAVSAATPWHGVAAGTALGLAAMARPDGVVFAVPVLVLLAIFRQPNARRPVYIATALFVVLYGAYFLWRMAYYGDLMPNTFYVKTGGTWLQWWRGARYLKAFLLSPIGLPYALVVLGAVRRGAPWRERAIALSAVVYVAYVLYVGGDAFPMFRFYVPVLLLAAALAPLAIAHLARALARRVRTSTDRVSAAIALVLLGLSWAMVFSAKGDRHRMRTEDRIVRENRQLGSWLRDSVPSDTLVAAVAIGAVGYYSDLPILDMLGLVDRTIAHTSVHQTGTHLPGHEKHNVPYVLARRPELIVHLPHDEATGEIRRGGGIVPATRALTADPALARLYVAERLPPGAHYPWCLRLARWEAPSVFRRGTRRSPPASSCRTGSRTPGGWCSFGQPCSCGPCRSPPGKPSAHSGCSPGRAPIRPSPRG